MGGFGFNSLFYYHPLYTYPLRIMSSTDSPSKTSGQMHSMKGSAVEAIGNLTNSKSWQSAGAQEHAQGEAETKAAQAKGYAEGTADRLVGAKDSIVGAVTGDDAQKAAGDVQGKKGEVKQDVNNPV